MVVYVGTERKKAHVTRVMTGCLLCLRRNQLFQPSARKWEGLLSFCWQHPSCSASLSTIAPFLLSSVALFIRFFGKRPVKQPAYVIREESLLPQADLSALQKRSAGPESLLIVCKACAENCFVPGRVSITVRLFWSTGVSESGLLAIETAPNV